MEFTTKKRILFGAVCSTLIVTLSACSGGASDVIQQRQVTQAPKSASDVGILLDGAKADEVATMLKAHPAATVRVLNAKHGLYEIYGMTQTQVSAEFAGVSEPNQFFTYKPQQRASLLSQPVRPGMQIPNLQPCALNRGAGGPVAVLSADQPAPNLNGSTVNLGTTISVNAKASQPGANSSGSALTTVMIVDQPESVSPPQIVQAGNTYQFTPTTMGAYKITAVVQDGSNMCAADEIAFVVTANRPYNGPNAQNLQVDLSKFAHLNMVSAQQAWQVSQGDGIIIAIVDTGANYNHPLLAPNILVNAGEIPDNNIDDDGNGFVDDYVGYDFANQDPYPYDDDSHGTHVSGLAAAKQFGLAPKAKILPVKALTPMGGDIGTIAAAIRYAVDRGANIINLSIGNPAPQSPAVMVSAARYAQSKGVLLIAAAGNGDPNTGVGYDIDTNPFYPASLSLQFDNVLAVAAFDAKDDLTSYSNFGHNTVGVAAPGGMIPDDPMISTAFENPQNQLFIEMCGTSMASPVVSGIAADVWSNARQLTYNDLKNILIGAGTDVPSLAAKTISGKHLNALSAVQATASLTNSAN